MFHKPSEQLFHNSLLIIGLQMQLITTAFRSTRTHSCPICGWLAVGAFIGLLFSLYRDGETIAWAFKTGKTPEIAAAIVVLAGSAAISTTIAALVWCIVRVQKRSSSELE